jgi:arylsulfatase A-like enzyme
VSLVPALTGNLDQGAAHNRALYLNYYGWSGIRYRDYKLISRRNALALIQPGRDPQESDNLADQHRGLARSLEKLLKSERKRLDALQP